MTKIKIDRIDDKTAHITGFAECGKSFLIGQILELDQENPLLEIFKPLGMNAMNILIPSINLFIEKYKNGDISKITESPLEVEEVKNRMLPFIDKYKDPEGMIESFVLQKNFTPEEIDLMIETGYIYEPIINKVKKV